MYRQGCGKGVEDTRRGVTKLGYYQQRTDSVYFVDEDDAGALGLGGLEEIPHSARPHPHIHLLKLTTRGIKKRYLPTQDKTRRKREG